MSNHEVYTKITARLIAAIEAGTVPWTAPVVGGGLPRNASSGRAYSGINIWATLYAGLANGYTSANWVTFKQALDLGLVVRKGQTATPILFMSKVMPRGGLARPDDDTRRPYFIAKSYSVFNLDQLDEREPGALGRIRHRTESSFAHDPVAACEATIVATGAEIFHKPDMPGFATTPAYYAVDDFIVMPLRARFPSAAQYYATLFHELIHWTGHASRLDRDLGARFGAGVDERYAAEELVAELGAAMLAHRFGFDVVTYSAAYLSTWLDAMHENPSFLVACASAASSAVEFLYPSDLADCEEVAA
jgi:antirestriction protein ArdC